MKKTLAALSAATLVSIALAACSSSGTTSRMAMPADQDLCGWSGSAADAVNAANAEMSGIDLSGPVVENFGDTATSGEPRISEIKFLAYPGSMQPIADATDLSQIDAIYNIPIYPDGQATPEPKTFASVHLSMTGLCPGSWAFVPQMWMETFGVDAPTLETQQAIDAGTAYLKENLGDEVMDRLRIQDMLLYKRLEDGFPLSWFMRGNINNKNFALQIDQDGTVTPK